MEKAVAWCKLANALEQKILAAEEFCKKQAPFLESFSEFLVGKRGKTMENPQVTMVVRSKMVELGDLGSLTKSEMASEN